MKRLLVSLLVILACLSIPPASAIEVQQSLAVSTANFIQGGTIAAGIAQAIGCAPSTRFMLFICGTFSPSGGSSAAIRINPTINAIANTDNHMLEILGTVVEAGAGVHSVFSGLAISGITVTNGAATTSLAANLYIAGAPTGATENYSMHVASGISNFGGTIRAGVTSPLQTAWFGTSGETRAVVTVGGNFTAPVGQQGYGLLMAPGITGAQGQDAYSERITLAFTKAGAGTHNLVSSMMIEFPGLAGGAATVTNASTVTINGEPSFGTNNSAMWIQAGKVRVTPLASATGTRFICADTNGILVSQAAACSGT